MLPALGRPLLDQSAFPRGASKGRQETPRNLLEHSRCRKTSTRKRLESAQEACELPDFCLEELEIAYKRPNIVGGGGGQY